MKKNSKVTSVASLDFVTLVTALQHDEGFVSALAQIGFEKVTKRVAKKSAAQFSDELGVSVTKKWVTLKPVMVNDITEDERVIQARAFKAAMARKVGYMQATYAGYHAVANSR
jgi:hypothetical protein